MILSGQRGLKSKWSNYSTNLLKVCVEKTKEPMIVGKMILPLNY